MSDTIKKLTDLFAKFPTIGSRTANRFVFYLLKLPKERIDELTNAIQELKNNIKLCQFCFNPFENIGNVTHCPICQSTTRNKQLLCVVEKEADLTSIENTGKYSGLYFILGGTLGFRKTEKDLRINELKERVKNTMFSEIIIAINPTPEGRSTSILIERSLKELQDKNFKITHLGMGLPFGGELEYADRETLESAFDGRK